MSNETTRDELRQVIGQINEISLAGSVWKKVGRMFAWLPGFRNRESPLWLSALSVLTLGILICAFVAWLAGASQVFTRSSVVYAFSVYMWVWLSILLADWQTKDTLNVIKHDAIGILRLPTGESQVREWVAVSTRRRNQVVIAIAFTFLICGLSSFTMGLDFSQPISWVILLFLLQGAAWWCVHVAGYMALMIFYGHYFRRWEINLFQDDPTSTVALVNLHRSGGRLLLISALIIALSIPVGWITNMLTPNMLLVSGVMLWIPMLSLYATIESGFTAQVRKAKDQRLAQLQNEIHGLEQRSEIPSTDTIKQVRELLEFHEQIKRKPNSLVNVDSLLNLLGSLALPLLGAVLNVLDIWDKLFPIP